MRRSTLVFSIFVAALLVIGIGLGVVVSGYERFTGYKLLNILGISYGLLGVVVLAEFVVKSEAAKAFMVHWVAGVLIWAQSIVPLGAVVGAGISYKSPSSGAVASFFVGLFAYSLFVLAIVESKVFNPKTAGVQSLGTRTKWFGITLLISGGVAQLIAALKDFNA